MAKNLSPLPSSNELVNIAATKLKKNRRVILAHFAITRTTKRLLCWRSTWREESKASPMSPPAVPIEYTASLPVGPFKKRDKFISKVIETAETLIDKRLDFIEKQLWEFCLTGCFKAGETKATDDEPSKETTVETSILRDWWGAVIPENDAFEFNWRATACMNKATMLEIARRIGCTDPATALQRIQEKMRKDEQPYVQLVEGFLPDSTVVYLGSPLKHSTIGEYQFVPPDNPNARIHMSPVDQTDGFSATVYDGFAGGIVCFELDGIAVLTV